ncbi:MAG: uracil-DNA glycosylase [Boseongicola sp.]|nr:MAG: uracil-DNA glycosylase [Boseongicola sp.]
MSHSLANLGPWSELPFFSEQWPAIQSAIETDIQPILPPSPQRFAALEHVTPEATRVLILGQDPYPTPGHANGLAFSVASDVRLPRSLTNIYKELETDIGQIPDNGDLTHWANQGVLLLNTALSVPAHDANGHARLGWDVLARQVMARLSDRPRAFILWGAKAQAYRQCIAGDDHLIIESAHPSPLSARRGFFGSKPFSKTNSWLTARGHTPIRWA